MSKARLDLGIELRRHCDRSVERYHDSVGRACLPKQMCNVVLYARKKAEFYKNNNPDLSKKWEAEAKYYEEQNNNEQPGAFPSSCDAAKVGATRKTRGGKSRRLTRRRGARASRTRPTR